MKIAVILLGLLAVTYAVPPTEEVPEHILDSVKEDVISPHHEEVHEDKGDMGDHDGEVLEVIEGKSGEGDYVIIEEGGKGGDEGVVVVIEEPAPVGKSGGPVYADLYGDYYGELNCGYSYPHYHYPKPAPPKPVYYDYPAYNGKCDYGDYYYDDIIVVEEFGHGEEGIVGKSDDGLKPDEEPVVDEALEENEDAGSPKPEFEVIEDAIDENEEVKQFEKPMIAEALEVNEDRKHPKPMLEVAEEVVDTNESGKY